MRRRQEPPAAERVLKTDVSGLQQLSRACVQVLHEVVEAEEQPRQVAPQPSKAQRAVAKEPWLAGAERAAGKEARRRGAAREGGAGEKGA